MSDDLGGRSNADLGYDEFDYFGAILPEDGTYTFTAIRDAGNSTQRFYLTILTKNGALQNYALNSGDNDTISVTVSCLAADTIYPYIDRYGGCGGYTLSFENTTPPGVANDIEDNGSMAQTSQFFTEGETVTGHIGYYDADLGYDEFDYFGAILPEDGTYTFTAIRDAGNSSQRFYLTILTKNGVQQNYALNSSDNDTISVTVSCLAADTIYPYIDRYGGCGGYTLSFENTTPPGVANDTEDNGSMAQTSQFFTEGETVTGHIGYYDVDTGWDEFDYFGAILPEDGTYTFTAIRDAGNSSQRFYLTILTKNGAQQNYALNSSDNDTISVTVSCLAADTIYPYIDRYGGCGGYTLSFSAPELTYDNDTSYNETLEAAALVPTSSVNEGHLGYYDVDTGVDKWDYYKFTVVQVPFDLDIKVELAESLNSYLDLLNSAGVQIKSELHAPGSFNYTRNITVAGDYYIRLHHKSGCGSYSLGNFCANAPEVAITANGPTDFCPGESVTLTATAGLNAYSWMKDGAEVGTDQSFVATEPGTYWVAGYDINGCDGLSEEVVIGVFGVPELAISTEGETTFCAGGSITLSASGGFASYAWSNGDTGSVTTVSESGSYSVTATSNDGCIAISSEVDVTVYPVPVLEITADGPVDFCEGDEVTLTASGGFASYAWSNGDTGSVTTVSESGSYSVTATSNDGCIAISSEVDVTVYPVPVLEITADGPVDFCEGDEVTLTASGGFASYAWSNGETGDAITVDESGDYSVTGTTSDGCTAASNTISVTVSNEGACAPDCFGVPGGGGVIDDCGECRNGTSDPLYNSTCVDCNGEVNGTAYFDNCGTCVGGSTGLEPCEDDCFGVPGGDGITDDCGECRHGTSDPLYNSTCVDCNGEVNGTAYYDNCGTCVGGSTGLEPCEDDCFGVPGGDGITDDCGECRHGVSDPLYNSTCADCEGVPNGPAQPGTACTTNGQDGTWNESCECMPDVTGCDTFRYFLSSANEGGGTDIFELFLDNGSNKANMVWMKTVDVPVSIAYDGVNSVLYLVYRDEATYRSLDVSAPDGALGAEVTLNATVNGFTGAAFGSDGLLYAASESAQKIYAHDTQTLGSPTYSHAAVAGGDIAFGQNGALYMVSEAPRKSFEIVSGGSNNALGYVMNNTSGLALMANGNFLLSVDGKKGLMVGDDQGNDTGVRFRYVFNGGDYYANEADLASDCADVGVAMLKPTGSDAVEAGIELSSSPNPTAGMSTVHFTTTNSEEVVLEVYDLSGRNLATLFEGQVVGGESYRFDFDGGALPNGVYIYRLTTEKGVEIEKFMIAR